MLKKFARWLCSWLLVISVLSLEGICAQPSAQKSAEYFGEVAVTPPSAVVGQPVKLRLSFFFRADIQFDNLQRPALMSDRAICGAIGEPKQTEEYVNSVPYNVVVFDTFIIPVVRGNVMISVAMEGQMQRLDNSRPAGVDPFFDQFFSSHPSARTPENIVVKARAELTVTELPSEEQPEDFSGLVGQFKLKASAVPDMIRQGQVVRFTVTLEGDGNFLGVDASVLLDPSRWRILRIDEGGGSESLDSLFGGSRSFSIDAQAMQPAERKPAIRLSFFNPTARVYQTVETAPVSVSSETE